jgi:hypothetical protein
MIMLNNFLLDVTVHNLVDKDQRFEGGRCLFLWDSGVATKGKWLMTEAREGEEWC